jgi:hypothetical protein
MPNRFRQMILCPETAEVALASNKLQGTLEELGLIGDAFDAPDDVSAEKRFYVGKHFLQHISFMGCAPAIEFVPPADEQTNTEQSNKLTRWDQFTFIVLPEPFLEPKWQADLEMAKPACPHCGKRISHSAQYIEESTASLTCTHCHHQASVCEYNWREFGGCAQTMISIVNVYPKEAIPSSNLLNQLTKLTEVSWRYFYIHGPVP